MEDNQTRLEFEAWYCAHAKFQGGPFFTPNEIAALRQGNIYGPHRDCLNCKWEAWQGAQAKYGVNNVCHSRLP